MRGRPLIGTRPEPPPVRTRDASLIEAWRRENLVIARIAGVDAPRPRRARNGGRWQRGGKGILFAVALSAAALTAACGAMVVTAPGPVRSGMAGLEGSGPVRSAGILPTPAAAAPAPVAAPATAPVAEPVPVRVAAVADSPAPPPADAVRPEAARAAKGARAPVTTLVSFEAAPFPYEGDVPGRGRFLDVGGEGARGHRTARGGVLWEKQTFSDDRVLIHIPPGFDPARPATLVVFFHGHGATLTRDVLARQQVPAQVTESGANVVLVAPQFAVDARDSSAGRFWEQGGFGRFLDEAAAKLARLAGTGRTRPFEAMPVVLVAYSGGFAPAAWSLKDPAVAARVRGVVLLDGLYGEAGTFADWVAGGPSRFLVSAYTRFTQGRNVDLERALARRGLSTGRDLPERLAAGATFLPTGVETNHTDYVTHAWTERPLADLLRRLPAPDAWGTALLAAREVRPARERRAAADAD